MAIIKTPDTDSFDLWRQKTNLASIEQGDLARLIVPLTYSLTGTVTSVADSLIGTGTLFLTELTVGSKVRSVIGGVERTISEITSNTSAKTSVAFTPALASEQISTVDIITALNSAYSAIGGVQRDILIRAIAMS
jgi:hypothetical protein